MQTSPIRCTHMRTPIKKRMDFSKMTQDFQAHTGKERRGGSVRQRKQAVIAALATCLLCAMLLAACGSKQSVGYTLTGSEVLPLENRKSVAGGGICPSSTSDGYYVCTNVVHYVDAQSGKTHTMCSQPGCSHNDSTCQAWIGQVSSYTEYHGQIYAIVKDVGHGSRFVRKDLAGGQITTIDKWEDTEDTAFLPHLGPISDQRAIISLETVVSQEENGAIIPDEIWTEWLYSLETGEKKMLFRDEPGESYEILGMTSESMAVIYTRQDQQLLDPESFAAQYGEDASYGRYLFGTMARELRLYRGDGSDYTVIAPMGDGGFVDGTNPNSVYGDMLVYQCGETLWLLNMRDGSTRELATAENQINYWMVDGKVFRITQNQEYARVGPDVEIQVDCIDPDTGEVTTLNNGGNRQIMEFTIYEEGGSFFVGFWTSGDGIYVLQKEDFYAERYQNGRRVG